MPDFKEVFEDLGELSPTVLVILSVLFVGFLLFLIVSKNKKQVFTTRMLAYGAMCVALSFILSCIRLFRMPQGGSITPASMLPIMAFAYGFGVIPGLFTGAAYGLLQLIQSPYIIHPVQVLLDYILAFTVLAFAGTFRKLKIPSTLKLLLGIVLSALLRFLCHFLAGATFYASSAPVGQSAWVYSLLYNSFVLLDALICIVIASLPPVQRAIERIFIKK